MCVHTAKSSGSQHRGNQTRQYCSFQTQSRRNKIRPSGPSDHSANYSHLVSMKSTLFASPRKSPEGYGSVYKASAAAILPVYPCYV
jgi:hypothetical protein